MVTVVALQDFVFKSDVVYRGQAIEMEPVEAAVESHKGNISLNDHPRSTYQRRDLTAETHAAPVQALQQPIKRRRGRPRKKAI